MASIRRIKRDIDFLANEVISDCYMALYFNDDAKREQIVAVIEEAVYFRTELFVRATLQADKKNRSLVRKHYAQMRREMMSRVDAMFEKLSGICK